MGGKGKGKKDMPPIPKTPKGKGKGKGPKGKGKGEPEPKPESTFTEGPPVRLGVSTMSGRSVQLEWPRHDWAGNVLKHAANLLGFPWYGQGAHCLMIDGLEAPVKGLDLPTNHPTLLEADKIFHAVFVNRPGEEITVIYEGHASDGAATSLRAQLVSPTLLSLQRDIQCQIGVDVSKCEVSSPHRFDKELNLHEHNVKTVVFTGLAKRFVAPLVPCVWNEFPAGGGYYVADFRGLVETHADTAESTAAGSGGKGKSKAGKGEPPAPPTGKGKKGKGKDKERPRWKEVPKWKETPLPPGYDRELPPEAEGLSESMYEARVNENAKEGFIIGWISGPRMWILQIINEDHTEEWLVEFDHLLIQGSDGIWAQPKAPSALDQHALAPSGDRASYVIRASKIFRIIHINKEAEEKRASMARHPALRTEGWAEAEVAAFKEKHPDITPVNAKALLCRTVSWAQREADAREARIAGLIVHKQPGIEGIVLGSRPKGPDEPPADAKWEEKIR